MNCLSFVLLLAAAAFAASVDPNDIMPCSFEAMTYTRVLSGGTEITSTIDVLYHDHDGLWRWDSEFKGLPGFFDSHNWRIIWRPDDDASYHEMTLKGTCVRNEGTKKYPPPYEWIRSKTDGVEWSKTDCQFNDQPAVMYTGSTSSKKYKFKGSANLFFSKAGVLLFGNGTVEGSLIDITFEMEVTKFTAHTALPALTFVPSPPCPATVQPDDPSREFQEFCYKDPISSVAAVIKPSILFFLATFLMAFMIFLIL